MRCRRRTKRTRLSANVGHENKNAMTSLPAYCRDGLDVLFVALNPPVQSHANGHWFSGRSSRFFHLLHQSGLITRPVQKENADEIVFGSSVVNYRSSEFGVIELVHGVVETNSSKVRPTRDQVDFLIERVRKHEPRFVCVLHSKVRNALRRYGQLVCDLNYGDCGTVLSNCRSRFFVNYFPNGNNVGDERKKEIFRILAGTLDV